MDYPPARDSIFWKYHGQVFDLNSKNITYEVLPVYSPVRTIRSLTLQYHRFPDDEWTATYECMENEMKLFCFFFFLNLILNP